MILCGPNDVIKLRRETPDSSQILPSLDDCIRRLCQGRFKGAEQLHTGESAMLESFQRSTARTGLQKFCQQRRPTTCESMKQGWKRRKSGRGDEPHLGSRLRSTRGSRMGSLLRTGSHRCCLLNTAYGLTDEEGLLTGLSGWATFHPRKKRPRQNPGHLHYPNESSHVFENSLNPRYLFVLPAGKSM
jgi:hypothetical protein